MQTVECATFHLNTNDISSFTNTSNQWGTINQYRNDITWNNIDFRTILGDMYDKYDKFNIKLSLVCHNNVSSQSANNQNLMLKINLVGLPFSNCTYHSSENSNMATCIIGAFSLPAYPTGIYFNDDNVFTIFKPPATTSIRLFLTTVDDLVPTWTIAGPCFDFYFRIYGVKKS